MANAPADPLKLFGDLPKNYGFAVRVLLKNVPEPLRHQSQMFLAQLQAQVASDMTPMPGKSDIQHNARMLGSKAAIQAVTVLANDLDEVLLGWNIDPSTNRTYLIF